MPTGKKLPSAALYYLDPDGFKQVNDRMGHDACDYLLREITQRLLKVVRGNDTVARSGGNEFVILFSGLKEPEDNTEELRRLLKAIETPVPTRRELANAAIHIVSPHSGWHCRKIIKKGGGIPVSPSNYAGVNMLPD
ncbi:GGDEF domain-containing protein [Candidatus Methylospira mobilis]|uniref:diguanylate cyclase domain-containing protein n=1 Tax=Candidatus Methylospira mobilis TaxID=1808979 RepID=UPI001884A1FC|nr:GGDEF domain-containing protein [Candidatus Methylospira mobilis]WNV04753.1 GGDEF domain-containing protein [Candidatus Methylospira mobilis]